MVIDAKIKAAVRAAYAAGTTSYDDLKVKFPHVGRGSLYRIVNDTSTGELQQHEALVAEAQRKKRKLEPEDVGTELITHCGSTFYVRRNTSDLTQLNEVFGTNSRPPYYLPQQFCMKQLFQGKDGGVLVIDAGANIGSVLVWCHFNLNVREYIAIEPFESNFRILERNKSLVKVANPKLLRAALIEGNSCDRTARLNVGNSGYNQYRHCLEQYKVAKGTLVTVPVTKVKSVIELAKQPSRYCLLKVDAEGIEEFACCEFVSLLGSLPASIQAVSMIVEYSWDNLEATLGTFRGWKLRVERALPEGWVLIGSLHEAAPHGATEHEAFKRLGVRASSRSEFNFMKFDGRRMRGARAS